jgi:hypothetical protein
MLWSCFFLFYSRGICLCHWISYLLILRFSSLNHWITSCSSCGRISYISQLLNSMSFSWFLNLRFFLEIKILWIIILSFFIVQKLRNMLHLWKMDNLRWKLGFQNLSIFISNWTLIILWINNLWSLTGNILYLWNVINTILNKSNILGYFGICIISLIICNKTIVLYLLLTSSPYIFICKVNIRKYALW